MFGIKNAAQVEQMVQSARQKVADVAAEGMIRDLSNAVNNVAHWEGAHEAFFIKERLESRDVAPALIAMELAGRMGNGADDSWSGRGNDVQRSRFDGFREAAQSIIRDIQYRMEEELEAAKAV